MRASDHRATPRRPLVPAVLPLASHIWYRADDGQDAYRWLAKTMMPRALTLDDRRRRAGVVNRASLGDIHFNIVKIGWRFQVDFDAIEDSYVVYLPLSGRLDATVGGEAYCFRKGSGLIASPDDPVHLDFSENAMGILIQIPRQRLERHLHIMGGGHRSSSLRFSPELDLAGAGGMACARMVDFLIEGLEHGIWKSAAVVGELERAFMSSLLVAQHNSHSELLTNAAPAAARPYYVQRAERFMRDHLGETLTLADLVRVAGVSERTLQAGFQRCYGTTPLRRLKGMRLGRIHQALIEATPGTTRVTELAAGYGFYQFGRFAADYKERYGVLPSETLRRAE